MNKRPNIEGLSVIKIDRNVPFDPTTFISGYFGGSEKWLIDEQDERSTALTEINSFSIILEGISAENPREVINGEKHLIFLKKEKDIIRLDAKILESIFEGKKFFHEILKQQTNKNTHLIMFEGTVVSASIEPRIHYCFALSELGDNFGLHLVPVGNDYPASSRLSAVIKLNK